MTEEQAGIKRVQLAGFSGYKKQEHSKCKKPEKYGLQRTAEAERAYNGKPPKPSKSHAGQFPNRLYMRLPDDEYKLLQQAFEKSSYKTMQDFLRAAVMSVVKNPRGNL